MSKERKPVSHTCWRPPTSHLQTEPRCKLPVYRVSNEGYSISEERLRGIRSKRRCSLLTAVFSCKIHKFTRLQEQNKKAINGKSQTRSLTIGLSSRSYHSSWTNSHYSKSSITHSSSSLLQIVQGLCPCCRNEGFFSDLFCWHLIVLWSINQPFIHSLFSIIIWSRRSPSNGTSTGEQVFQQQLTQEERGPWRRRGPPLDTEHACSTIACR